MKWLQVKSSQIDEIGYDSITETLGIRFKRGSEYQYSNVPEKLFNLMAASDSVGSFFGANIKNNPESYPFVKVEAENPTKSYIPAGTTDAPIFVAASETDNPGSALALVDTLKPEFVFAPGNMDSILMKIREQALAMVAGLNISTPKMRAEIKRVKNLVVKSRTYIDKMRVGYVSEEKKRLATVDAEARRIKDIFQGIEEEVARSLTEWENAEKERSDALERIVNYVNAIQPYLCPDIDSLMIFIAKVNAIEPETMQEWKVAAEVAKEKALSALTAELVKRQCAEAQQEELAKLRAESAARDEENRLAALKIALKEEAERAGKEALAAAEQMAKDAEAKAQADLIEAARKAEEAEQQAILDKKAAIEGERHRVEGEKRKAEAEAQARDADESHRLDVYKEASESLTDLGLVLSKEEASAIISAISNHCVPHVTITY